MMCPMTRPTTVGVVLLLVAGLAGCATGPSRDEVKDAFYAAIIANADGTFTESTVERDAENMTRLAVDEDACGSPMVANILAEKPNLLAVWDDVCEEFGL